MDCFSLVDAFISEILDEDRYNPIIFHLISDWYLISVSDWDIPK